MIFSTCIALGLFLPVSIEHGDMVSTQEDRPEANALYIFSLNVRQLLHAQGTLLGSWYFYDKAMGVGSKVEQEVD